MTTTRLSSSARGVGLILLAGVSVGAWAVHVFVLTGLARLHQRHPEVIWIIQAVTVVTAIPGVVAAVIGWRWLRSTVTPEDEGSPTGRTVFLCWMTIVIGLFNVLLIVLETVFVSALHGYV